MPRRGYVFGLFLVALPLAGCSKERPYGVVEGVVTLDGKPLTNVEVVFMPDPEKGNGGRRSTAVPDKDGHFRIASDMGQEGAPVGFHRVVVNDLLKPKKGNMPAVKVADDEKGGEGGPVGVKAPPKAATDPNEKKKLRFSDDYSDAIKTPFKDIEVKEGSQVIDLALKSK